MRQIKHRQSILKAIDKFDQMGEHAFLSHYGFNRSTKYPMIYKDTLYPSKAIVAVAHEFEDLGRAMTSEEAFGGPQTTGQLTRLGFEFRDLKKQI